MKKILSSTIILFLFSCSLSNTYERNPLSLYPVLSYDPEIVISEVYVIEEFEPGINKKVYRIYANLHPTVNTTELVDDLYFEWLPQTVNITNLKPEIVIQSDDISAIVFNNDEDVSEELSSTIGSNFDEFLISVEYDNTKTFDVILEIDIYVRTQLAIKTMSDNSYKTETKKIDFIHLLEYINFTYSPSI